MSKPFSQACENNKGPILEVLKRYFTHSTKILEIGSGTGQHGVHFAAHLPHLSWQMSDALNNHKGINQWIAAYPQANIHAPISFVVGQDPWPGIDVQSVFSANTAHIMQKHECKLMMGLIAKNLPSGGIFCQYGPFTQDGQFNAQSNADFDLQLKSNGYGGIRDISELRYWGQGLRLVELIDMPANNLCLVWQKH
ncbi:MAG: class I SAM-dependent methyltransferase [Paraglaciecola sp.]|uniref:DUF938 domain-containing protein n=1 Tax=Paraglaciecola sp. TaxID=1920173 RepID=UPI00273FA39C|nr:DUF938 domain-containing protein [Paraglaciecola sp.]MDP5031871.1 class I SAM-dependent methyltransferase [Paraglaciecola sp.]MDP5133702.1 class I SAM-dependent methyltransferase [Paraglaciecola sp.]